ncbi:hypothetical protein CR513_08187, partial [Mucuna pruriens]
MLVATPDFVFFFQKELGLQNKNIHQHRRSHGCDNKRILNEFGLGKSKKGSITLLEVLENKGDIDWDTSSPKVRKVPIYDIRKSFQSARWVNIDQVVVTIDDLIIDVSNFGYLCSINIELNNWKVTRFPTILNYDSIANINKFISQITFVTHSLISITIFIFLC